jgi:hypothetical protein
MVRPIVIPLSRAERLFLLCRLRDIVGTAEAILHHPAHGSHVTPWVRPQVVSRVAEFRQALRDGAESLVVIGGLSEAILAEAIHGNPYFAAMSDWDPRLCPEAIRQADALRLKISRAIRHPVGPVPLGAGRVRRTAGQRTP